MRTLNDRLAEMVEWGIQQWDAAIDAALVEFGSGAKPDRGERMMHSRDVYAALRDVAEGIRRIDARQPDQEA